MYLYGFFFNDSATTEIYTLSLHDALPIWKSRSGEQNSVDTSRWSMMRSSMLCCRLNTPIDRKSTRLNSSHITKSYAVFCLKKKKEALNAKFKRASSKTLCASNYSTGYSGQ